MSTDGMPRGAQCGATLCSLHCSVHAPLQAHRLQPFESEEPSVHSMPDQVQTSDVVFQPVTWLAAAKPSQLVSACFCLSSTLLACACSASAARQQTKTEGAR